MAVNVALSMVGYARLGSPTQFTVTLSNTGGSDVDVSAGALTVTTASGLPSAACNIPPLVFPPNRSATVTASGTLLVPMTAIFFGASSSGAGPAASDQFAVTANFTFSDDSTASSPILLVGLAEPTTPITPVTLDFSKAGNSSMFL